MKFVIALCLLVVYSDSAKLPSNFKTCNRSDPNFKKCLLEAGQYGITQFRRPYKQLKLPNLEPLEIKKLIANVDSPLVNVTSILSDCKFYGLTYTKLENFEFDFDKKTIAVSATFPKLSATCDKYEIDGRIAILPIKGEGASSATFKNFHWTFNLTYEEVKKRGKTYVQPKTSYFDGKPEDINFELKNLFGGDEELGKSANRMLNENWNALYDDVKFVYMNNARDFWLQIMKGLFTKISLEEAFDN